MFHLTFVNPQSLCPLEVILVEPHRGLFFCFRLDSGYNEGMENEIRGNCCGRPMEYAKPGCKFNNDCLSETCGCTLGRIKKDADSCKACAVIPALTVDTVSGITNLANCFVHVTSTNTTFYIDDKHRPMIIWAGPVEISNYDISANEFNLRSQTCYTAVNGVYSEVYFDKQGVAHIIGQEA